MPASADTIAATPVSADSHTPPTLGAESVTAAHLTFVPATSVREAPQFFLWGKAARDSFLAVLGHSARVAVLDEDRRIRAIRGYGLPLLDTVRALATVSANEAARQPSSINVWSTAAKLACELVARERVAPCVARFGDATYARSRIVLNLLDDDARAKTLASSFPLAAHAVPIEYPSSGDAEYRIWTATALLHAFFDAVADALVRTPQKRRRATAMDGGNARNAGAVASTTHVDATWPERWAHALSMPDARFAPQDFSEHTLLAELLKWSEPALSHQASLPRLSLRLELPQQAELDDARKARFPLRFFLHSADDREVLLDAATIYRGDDSDTGKLGCAAQAAEEYLLRDLSLAARLFKPIDRAMHEAHPDRVELTAESAWNLIAETQTALHQAGVDVLLPKELANPRHYRLQLRMRIGAPPSDARVRNDVVNYVWEAEVAGELLRDLDIAALLERSGPLLNYRNRWIAVERDELELARRLLHKRGGHLPAAAALAAVLSETIRQPGSDLPIAVVADGEVAAKLQSLRDAIAHRGDSDIATPADFHGTLRPYQLRGVAWLEQLAQLGLGACLADDMGLGKTIQLIAYLLRRREKNAADTRPILLACPTSVIGNWQRELARFAPSLPVLTHDGVDRATSTDAFGSLQPSTVVLISYAILRRDAGLLAEIEWSAVVLDEAQNIKNADSIGARTARSLRADTRIALTGTPVENRLDELWSICEFLNPGLLGPLATFRREVAIPIERFGRDDVAETLKRIVRPLILRRVKSDTHIIQDLPSKQESKEFCLLTREQAMLYQSALDENMLEIEVAEGIERRGRVLKLITALKQICNHPAQYLKEDGPLAQRSGKLERLRAMLEEVLASGERALIFTQYREMGARLTRELTRYFGREVLFLHGGVPRAQRDAMIERFQHTLQNGGDKRGPSLFVLSVKAGGTGLNLVAATHVFHFDRWWNPAVEDQATDRAYRIGQTQRVQVHKFLCAGTIEERVDAMLESKRDLAASIVGQGEQWLTELNNEQLRELFTLSPAAIMEDDALDEAGEASNASPPSKPRRRKSSRRARTATLAEGA